MDYVKIVDVYEELSGTTKGLEKTKILSEFLKKLKGNEEWIYLFRGRVFPDYDESEFGISTQLVIKSISKAGGVSKDKVISRLRSIGDLGEIAEEFIGKGKQEVLFSKKLSVKKVFENLKKLVSINGKGSVDRKLGLIIELLTSAGGKEAKYIARTLLNDLRVGVADGLLRDSVAKGFFHDGDGVKELVESAYDKVNDWAHVLKLAQNGRKALESVKIVPGRPMKVMLPVKVTELEEAFRICGKPLAVEHKYDGFRAIISKNYNGEISLFTRKLDNVTNQFPDVVEIIKKQVKGKSFIIDSEIVGYDKKTGRPKPFEAISQRIRRKYDINDLIKKLPVEVNVFDVMFYNGESVLDLKFIDRRKLLEKFINPASLKIRLSRQFISSDEKEILEFYKDALKTGEEGVMMKKLDAPYRPGRRIGYIVKMKPDAKDFDLVITGAEYGSGKRAGGLTSFYVACKDGEKEFLEVGKVSSGLKEKEEMGTSYKEIDKLLQPLIIKEKDNYVKVKPKVVVSVTYQNIQKSPRYSSGFALRFPRITHYRPERGIYDIATLKEIGKEAGLEKSWGFKKGLS
ncbi:MAG: ATP-dependent DNA ligase [Candidatus Pacearchaeota archaeon]|nr:ATP-dependent DNA ligase [Candidatus Pacearchaeota archaeon]